jgi:hypothetical protein
MRRLALVTASFSACVVVSGLVAFALDPWLFSTSSVALIAIGLMLSALVALAGLLLVRAPWGRWGLALAVVTSMILASANPTAAIIVVLVAGAVATILLLGPWLRFWVRQYPAIDAPNAVATGLIAIAPVAPLLVGLGAFDSVSWTQGVAAFSATGSSFAYARAVPGAIWALRLAMPVTAVAAAMASPMPSALIVGFGALVGTVAAWLPAARQATALPSPVLPAPRAPRKDDNDATQ